MAVTNTGKVQSTSKVIDLSKVQSVFMRPKVTVIINNSNVSTLVGGKEGFPVKLSFITISCSLL